MAEKRTYSREGQRRKEGVETEREKRVRQRGAQGGRQEKALKSFRKELLVFKLQELSAATRKEKGGYRRGEWRIGQQFLVFCYSMLIMRIVIKEV